MLCERFQAKCMREISSGQCVRETSSNQVRERLVQAKCVREISCGQVCENVAKCVRIYRPSV